jgi:lipoprotein-releasing system permease protein
LNLEYFIAKRLISVESRKSTISTPIIKIAIAAIAIGMIMMIVSVATGIGLQQKIREKVAAFNGHIIISNYDDNQSQVSVEPVSLNQRFYPKFNSIEGINHIQAVASKAGIIRTANAFEGIIFKGVGKEYQWKNVSEYLVAGKLPDVSHDLNSQVLLSKFLADRLNLKVGDNFNTFFMKDKSNQLPNLRVFQVTGFTIQDFRNSTLHTS